MSRVSKDAFCMADVASTCNIHEFCMCYQCPTPPTPYAKQPGLQTCDEMKGVVGVSFRRSFPEALPLLGFP